MNFLKNFKQPKIKLKNAKRKKKSSVNWLQRQINDPFVSLSKQKGYRSRASFKIIEINDKFKIFKKGYKVLDLGSAPGGWSQVAVEKVGKNNVVAVDILDMNPIDGVLFIKQDFLQDDAQQIILNKTQNQKFDIVLSDMASNTTGNKNIDHIRTANLVESAFDFSLKVLKENGCFVSKIFQGGAEPQLFNKIKQSFKIVKHFKPQSSRKESVEMYIVAIGFRAM